MERDFLLAMAGTDVRMIFPSSRSNSSSLCEETLGIHIDCCSYTYDTYTPRVTTCSPPSIESLFLFIPSNYKLLQYQIEMMYLLIEKVRGSILILGYDEVDIVKRLLPPKLYSLSLSNLPIHIELPSVYNFKTTLVVDMAKHNVQSYEKTETLSKKQQIYRSTSKFHFKYGVNIAELKNVCLYNKTTILYQEVEADFYSIGVREHLKSSQSGFYSKTPGVSGLFSLVLSL